MTVKIYIDWGNYDILNEKEAKICCENDYLADKVDLNGDFFCNWLDDNYTSSELFGMTEAEKEKLLAKFRQHAQDCAWDEFVDDHEEREIEV